MTTAEDHFPDTHHDDYSKTTFGFWIYLLSDLMFFGTLFAAYFVLSKNTFGGPTPKEIFILPETMIETILLLGAAFTAGLGGVYAHRKKKGGTIIFFLITFVLGLGFLPYYFREYFQIFEMGYSWKSNGFLSMYFTLTATFALHVIVGLLWILVLLPPVFKQGITPLHLKRLSCLRIFWQFVSVVWTFIFTFVYLLGVL
ncbi:MAG: cytochrome c oxidase subunit 3 [Chlamydiales bacterium]|nr:cytochrome c oxidase subunit 3 [Chlamydiales bacterium]